MQPWGHQKEHEEWENSRYILRERRRKKTYSELGLRFGTKGIRVRTIPDRFSKNKFVLKILKLHIFSIIYCNIVISEFSLR
jgi:hypothetical protein